MADNLAYLEPGFNPSSLTVPNLRSILVTHDVRYSSSAKKPDLIELFNLNIVPQAKKLKRTYTDATRSAKGIVDVPSNNPPSHDRYAGDDDPQLLETPGGTSRRSTRRATRLAVEETPQSRSTRNSTAPPSSIKRSKTSDAPLDESVLRPAKRISKHPSRQSLAPRYSEVAAMDEPQFQQGPESPFTRDNPFQSASSPPSGSDAKRTEKRRSTLASTSDDENVRRSSAKGRTPTRKSLLRSPRSREFHIKQEQYDDEDEDIIAGEEFAPEEQEELAQERESGRRPLPIAKCRPRKTALAKAAPWSVVLALLGGVATVWRQEKIQTGYCGVSRPPGAVEFNLPGWAANLQPQCEPCPQHAYCYPGLKTVCENDFILTRHPLSLNGLVPLVPSCEPDSEKVRRIKQVADFAVETELRERNAKYECGEIKTPEISASELKATVAAKRSKRMMSDKDFDELWDSALGEIVGREEVTSKQDGSRSVVIRSTSLARVSFGCALKRSIRSTLRQHVFKLVSTLFLCLGAVYARHAFSTRTSTKSRAKQLAGVAMDKLATQASLHAIDDTAYPEPWISMVALRDDVLREEFSARERNRLWEVVKQLVENNANVRPMVRESRSSGEVSRVWEWTGALQRVESRPSTPDLRRSSSGLGLSRSRLSLRGTASPPDRAEFGGLDKWNDGARPYY